MVVSIDGRTTRGQKPNTFDWASAEDQAHFARLKNEFPVIVMGSGTYLAVKDYLQLSPTTLRIVMTQHVEEFAAKRVPGQLEFSSETPRDLLHRLAAQQIERVLLVGGSHINSAFFTAGLIDEIQLTLEPWVFGEGLSLSSGTQLNLLLNLKSVELLNSTGTLLLKYQVSK
jgi:dihydrofolate reductase